MRSMISLMALALTLVTTTFGIHALEMQPVLSLELAQEAATAAVASCVAKGYNETVVVVDADGVQRVVLRGNNSGAHSIESAFRKAYTSASFNQPTALLRERVVADPDAVGLQNLSQVLLVGGGLPIRVGNKMIGAIGAAGAPGVALDEACAQAGIDKIKDRLK